MIHPKLHALLATSRVANIPSVASNIWVGIVMGIMLNSRDVDPIEFPEIPWSASLRLTLAGICLYVAGNFCNDWMDRAWDRQHRPRRALPAGLFQPVLYRNLAIILSLLGPGLAASVNVAAGGVAVVILACVIIYTIWHKRTVWAVLPMGLCRGFLPVMGATGIATASTPGEYLMTILFPASAAMALFCYIAGLSLSARHEAMNHDAKAPAKLIGSLFVISALFMAMPFHGSGNGLLLSLAGLASYAAWVCLCQTAYRATIPGYVSALLAGIPLVDWIFLLPFALGVLALNPAPHPLIVGSLLVPPLAFLAALLLQRLAPAT